MTQIHQRLFNGERSQCFGGDVEIFHLFFVALLQLLLRTRLSAITILCAANGAAENEFIFRLDHTQLHNTVGAIK